MKKLITLCFICLYTGSVFANVRLPKIFNSNMVLQRDKPVNLWGWADAGETVTINFNGQHVKIKTAKDGRWKIILAPVHYGGPFEMTITGKSSILLTNILVGDVWLCSGQSNMEWLVKNSNNAAAEIENAAHPSIRLFTVEKATAFKPASDVVNGQWLQCDPTTIGDFSAVAYYFGRKINQDINVPIGLISSSYGGTIIEAWTSWDIMGKDEQYKTVDLDAKEKENAAMQEKINKYREAMKNDKGEMEKWYASDDTSGWKTMELPQLWEKTGVGNADGIIWFKKEFDLLPAMEGKPATIHLGPVDDDEITYLNGEKIGTTIGYNIDRVYKVDPSLLLKGKNTIVVKVIDNGGGGGLYGSPGQLFIDGNGSKISLAGTWQYKPSVLTTQYGVVDAGPNSFPSQLYNAMIAPLVPLSIKGITWYQGESNIAEAYKYRQLFADMISDWREKWKEDVPFIWVQIANLFPPAEQPAPSYLAELRESQHTALSLSQTAEVITIDIGEANDIHPKNKQDVGRRMGLAAEKIAYGKDSVFTGPQFLSATTENNKIILTVNSMGSGLMVKDRYGYLKGFSIAGEDQKFSWAKACIEGDKIIVYSDSVSKPVAARYAWSDNPGDANLYNKEGLPASPFRTDSWKGLTDK